MLNQCYFHFSINISDAYYQWAGYGGKLLPTLLPVCGAGGAGDPGKVGCLTWKEELVN
jgi:hypothetical protein